MSFDIFAKWLVPSDIYFYLTFRYVAVLYQWLFTTNSEDVIVQSDLLPMHKAMLKKLDSFRDQKGFL